MVRSGSTLVALSCKDLGQANITVSMIPLKCLAQLTLSLPLGRHDLTVVVQGRNRQRRMWLTKE